MGEDATRRDAGSTIAGANSEDARISFSQSRACAEHQHLVGVPMRAALKLVKAAGRFASADTRREGADGMRVDGVGGGGLRDSRRWKLENANRGSDGDVRQIYAEPRRRRQARLFQVM